MKVRTLDPARVDQYVLKRLNQINMPSIAKETQMAWNPANWILPDACGQKALTLMNSQGACL